MVKKIGIIVIALMMAVFSVRPVYADGDLNIAQVIDNLPEIVAYVDQTDLDFAQTEAYLGNQKLLFKGAERLSDTDEGTNYYILVDSSNSVPTSYTRAIQNGLISFGKSLRSEDTMVIYTFGAKIKEVTNNTEDAATQQRKIQTIAHNERQTKLFKAVTTVAAKAAKNTANNGHSVLIVISDGEDFATGVTTKKEALNDLKEKNMPVYGIAVNSASKANKNSFGEFARETGGSLTIANDSQMTSAPTALKKQLDQSIRLTYDYGTNKVTNNTALFTIKDQDSRANASKSVKLIHFQKDETAPVITDIQVIDDQKLEVIFSENVINAGEPANYQVKCHGERLKIKQAAYGLHENRYSAMLTFDEKLYHGTYTITCKNIKDASTEGHALTERFEKQLEDFEKQPFYQALWFKILIGLLVFLLFLILFMRRRRKTVVAEEEEEPEEVEDLDATVPLTTVRKDPEVAFHHIDTPPIGKKMSLDIMQDDQLIDTIETTVDHSIIIGSSGACDYTIDNRSISKQHVAIEVEQDDVYVTDLDSLNGTYVNGVRITKKVKVKSYDVLTIGIIQIRLRWP